MPWPIPVFPKIEYPKPIPWRFWFPALAVMAVAAAGCVLLLWPHGKPTNTVLFWATLVGAPLVACALSFGPKLDQWEEEQTDAEESETEQHRLQALWREWTRRNLFVVDAVAFPAATHEIIELGESNSNLQSHTDRAVEFKQAKGRSAMFRRTRLLHLVAKRFADAVCGHREVVVTLMLEATSIEDLDAWTQRARYVFSRLIPGVSFRIETEPATSGPIWLTDLLDRIDTSVRIVIAAQIWADGIEEQERTFSEGAAAFLIDPGASHAGSIFRPMTCTRDTLEFGLAQIKDYQMPGERLALAWFTGCEEDESTAIRSALTTDPKDSAVERLLDKTLGLPGPVSGWIALAIAMEAMRGGAPQLVAWREPESEPIHLCVISPLPVKETTV